MIWNLKENNRKKHLFRSYCCLECNQTKPCRILTEKGYCCSCFFENEKEKSQEYSNYQLVYQQKVREKKEYDRQLLLLKSYLGCKECESKEVDAYELYENSQLVCRPCLIKKEGGASGSVSFLEKSKWYKRYWGINLIEWLENFSQLPVNAECAREWLRDRNHLNSCKCLEKEVKELVDLFNSSLKEWEKKLKECKCEISPKTRTPYYDSKNYGYTYCEKCEMKIEGAGKTGVIKNRNDPSFWGLNIEEKVLCLKCLEKFQEKMPIRKRYTFNKYVKRYCK